MEKYICSRNYKYQVNILQMNSKKTETYREMQKWYEQEIHVRGNPKVSKHKEKRLNLNSQEDAKYNNNDVPFWPIKLTKNKKNNTVVNWRRC